MRDIPQNIRHIHLIAVCGTGMGSLALLLQSRGFTITGSDENIYPPMSTELERNGIGILQGFVSKNLEPAPDLVIVGNAVSKDNPEVVTMLDKRIPYLSMPQAISHFFLQNKRSIVVSGTHGKTTTSAILSHLLIEVGADPSFWFGGIFQRQREMLKNYRLGGGDLFVIEGDEYDTAFFDKGPKFLHYQPFYTIITSLEFDHADIYRDLEHLASSFEKLIRIVDPKGYLLYCADYPRLADVIASPPQADDRKSGHGEPVESMARGPSDAVRQSFGRLRTAAHRVPTELRARNNRLLTESYGQTSGAIWQAVNIAHAADETRFDLLHDGQKVFSFRSPMAGSHNVLNAVAAIVLLHKLGYPFEEIQRGLLTFAGVKRRQEVRGVVNDIVVIDDFAHHPTAVRETIDAVRKKYAGHTLWAVFEPRSNTSRRALFQKEFAEAFAGADQVILADVFVKGGGFDPLDVDRLVADISSHGVEARHISGVEKIVEHLAGSVRPKSVVLIMSNGGFGGIHEKVLRALRENS